MLKINKVLVKSSLLVLTGSIYGFMLFVSSICSAESYPQSTTTPITTDLSMNQYKLKDVGDIITKGPWGVDVRAFGAVGDGVADDTAAFNAAGATGKVMEVPYGTYKITGSVTCVGMRGWRGNAPRINLSGAGTSIILSGGETDVHSEFSYLRIFPDNTITTVVEVRRQRIYSRGILIYGLGTQGLGSKGFFFNLDSASQSFHDIDDFFIGLIDYPFYVGSTVSGFFTSNRIGSVGAYAMMFVDFLTVDTAQGFAVNEFGAYLEVGTNAIAFKSLASSGNTFKFHLDEVTYLMLANASNNGNIYYLPSPDQYKINPASTATSPNDAVYSHRGPLKKVAKVSGGETYYVSPIETTVICDATAGNINIQLPYFGPSAAKGNSFNIIKIDSSPNTVSVNPSYGELINGRTSVVLRTQWEHMTITCDDTNWEITSRVPMIKVVSVDPGSIAGRSTLNVSVTVPGVEPGDPFYISPPAGIEAALIWCAFVSASNTITIRFYNTQSSSINPAAGNWTFSVLKKF